MTIEEKMNEYLEDYEDLWQEICDLTPVLPIMDLGMNIIDEDDYYGCDFSGDKKVMMLFFTGQSNYFPGIYIGNRKYKNELDKLPIYIFDLASDNQVEYIGNFREYMTKIFDELLERKDLDVDFRKRIKEAAADIQQFSKESIKYKYNLKTK